MANYDYLNALENDYQQAETAETGGRLPNGRYTAILNEARLYPPDEKRPYPRFSTSWIVTDGEYKGRYIYLSFNFTPQGFPYYKAFAKGVGVDLPHLAMLPDHLQDFSGKIAQLTLAEQKNDPRYQNVYFDRLLGTGNPADYQRKAQPAASADGHGASNANNWQPVDEDEDLPF